MRKCDKEGYKGYFDLRKLGELMSWLRSVPCANEFKLGCIRSSSGWMTLRVLTGQLVMIMFLCVC